MTPPVSAPTFDLREMVRARTRELHDQLEALPLAVSIVEERVTRAHYAALLRNLLPLHRALEAGLAQYRRLGDFVVEGTRAHLIEADLEFFGEASEPVHPVALEVAERTRELCQTEAGALGCAYVVVGSRMGGLVLERHLSRALELEREPGRGLDYHLSGARGFPQRWRGLCGALSSHITGPAEGMAFGKAAVAQMRAFYDLYSALGEELGL